MQFPLSKIRLSRQTVQAIGEVHVLQPYPHNRHIRFGSKLYLYEHSLQICGLVLSHVLQFGLHWTT
jgi:hypothetical protein